MIQEKEHQKKSRVYTKVLKKKCDLREYAGNSENQKVDEAVWNLFLIEPPQRYCVEGIQATTGFPRSIVTNSIARLKKQNKIFYDQTFGSKGWIKVVK